MTSEDKLQAILAALHERQKMKKDALDDFEKRKQRMRVIFVLKLLQKILSSHNRFETFFIIINYMERYIQLLLSLI